MRSCPRRPAELGVLGSQVAFVYQTLDFFVKFSNRARGAVGLPLSARFCATLRVLTSCLARRGLIKLSAVSVVVGGDDKQDGAHSGRHDTLRQGPRPPHLVLQV